MGSGLQTVRMAFAGIEDLRRAVAGANLSAVQLKEGPFSGKMLHADAGDVLFSAGVFSGDIRVRGAMHPDHVTLGLVLDDRARVSQWSLDAEPGDVFIFPKGGEEEGRFTGQASYATISLDVDHLRQLSENESGRAMEAWDRPRRWRAPREVRAAMCRSIAGVASQLEHMAPTMTGQRLKLFQRSLVDMFFMGVVLDEDEAEAHCAYPGAKLVRDVEDWVDGQAPASIHVSDISGALNVSRRTLERSFHETLGIGPAQYLKARRLAAVRSILRSADPRTTQVTEIALDHGFWELGRFAVTYRRAFGEKPSETLRRV